MFVKSKDIGNYENILRAIGQGLEALEVKAFDLDVSDNHFIVSGEAKKPKSEVAPQPDLKKSFFSLILHGTKNTAGQASGSKPFCFTGLRFTPSDVELLERKGEALQGKMKSSPPDPHSLSQALRTVGTYLDLHDYQLRKISWRDGNMTLWRLNKQGVESKGIWSPRTLYDQWVHQYKQRSPMPDIKRTGND